MKYDQPPKATQSVIFLGTHIDNHLNIKLHLEYIERASLIRRMRITRLNLIIATLLIRLYNVQTLNYTCTALIALTKTPRKKLEVTRNHCLHYARRAVGPTCISNNELRSCCNIVNLEQCILAFGYSWWRKASKNNDYIINFTYHNQTNTKA